MKRLLAGLVLALAAQAAWAGPFELTDTEGGRHSLAAHRGKWVVLNVWATWCAPCLQEMPELEELAKSGSHVVVLGLSADERDARVVRSFARRLHVSYPVFTAHRGVLQELGVRAYPTTIVYDRLGVQVAKKEGKITRAEIDAIIGRAAPGGH